jgi:hypothetical protein
MHYLVLLLGGALAWERFFDRPDQTVINQSADWKAVIVIGLAAAGGYYLANRLTRHE